MLAAERGALHIEVVKLNGQAELHLMGELDAATVDRLEHAMQAAIEGGAINMVLDLSALEFIDSTGLNQLVVAHNRQRANGGEIVLRGPTAQTFKLLGIVGLTEIFRIT